MMNSHGVESNVTFSSGPSRNSLSMYSTSNSVLFPNHFANKSSSTSSQNTSWKPPYPMRAGHIANTTPYVPTDTFSPPEQRITTAPAKMNRMEYKAFKDRYIDPDANDVHRQSMAKSSYKPENSLRHIFHEAKELTQELRNGSISDEILQKPVPTGYATNISGPVPKKHVRPREESPSKLVLSVMKTRNQVEAENEGRGPTEMSTTTSVFHNRKGLADAELPQSLREIDENKKRSLMYSGGFSENRKHTKVGPVGTEISGDIVPDEVHPDRTMRSTYYNYISGPVTKSSKYFRTNLHGLDHISHSETMKLKEDKGRRFKESFSGYAKSEFPVNGVEQRVLKKATNEQLFNDDRMHSSVRKTLKRHDPVQYDSLQIKDAMHSTYARGHNMSNITFDKLEPATARAVMQSFRSTQITSGYTRNNTIDSEKKMRDDDIVNNQNVQAELRSVTTARASYRHPAIVENNDTRPQQTVNTTTGYSRSIANRTPYLHNATAFNNEFGVGKLSESLTSDRREILTKHPTIQKMLTKRRPAQYNEHVVSMYEHKSRIQT